MDLSSAEIIARHQQHRTALEAQPLPASLGALLDAAAEDSPDTVYWAPLGGGPSLTYRDFHLATCRCAAALAALGVRPGSLVAVMLPNIPEYAITWFALAKLGAAMVAINTRYTAPELTSALDIAQPGHIVIEQGFLSVLDAVPASSKPARANTIVCGADRPQGMHDWTAIVDAAGPAFPAPERIDPDALFSIQFTSGSTARPKGCMLSQRYWLILGLVRSQQGPPVSRVLVDAPLHYMGAQWRLLMTMYLRGTAYVAERRSLTHYVDQLAENRIEFASVTDAQAKLPDDPRLGHLSLRWMSSSGMRGGIRAAAQKRMGAPIRELYGSTEAGSCLYVPIDAEALVGTDSCGLPAPYRSCAIVDATGKPVARGEPGELLVSGPGILLGYYRNPEATAASFHGEWFRTGDLFRQDEDGFYYILGRIKDIVRRSGENISALEVEAVVRSIPGIVDAAVIPVPDERHGEEVKVFLMTPDGRASPSPTEIAAHCQAHLAAFKRPRFLEYRSALPLTSSGKVSKGELRNADHDPRSGCFDLVEDKWT